jgi:exonuclease SbcD
MGHAFRFLHSGDFDLQQPLTGLAEIPDALRPWCVDAPFTAAQRVFDVAIREKVDFVVLSGNLLDIDQAGPRSVAFLLEQFERLNEQDIAVYWSGGVTDPPQQWPGAARIPKNVQLFPAYQVEEFSHYRVDKPIACVRGRSWQGPTTPIDPLAPDFDHLFTVAISYGQYEVSPLLHKPVSYWALGGSPHRLTHGDSLRTVHYPGSPQGRKPQQAGPHGCSLVHVESDGKTRVQLIPTDAVRFQTEDISLDPTAPVADQRRPFLERVKTLRQESDDRPLLVTWELRLSGSPTLAQREKLASEMLTWLRNEFGGSRIPLWSISVECASGMLSPSWLAEDTMLGEFLRAVEQACHQDDVPLDLSSFIPARHQQSSIASMAQVGTGIDKQTLLREAALLGAQLLGADERGPARLLS